MHVIVTRFNVGLYSGSAWSHDKNGTKINPDEWMIERISLFEKFTLPSFVGQTDSNFIWYIAVDYKTPENYRKYFEKLSNNFVFIRVIYVEKLIRDFVEKIKIDFIETGYYKLITTRVDNDDAVSIDFIETIKKIACDLKFGFINLNKGYAFDLIKKKFYSLNYKSNPFISVVESVGDIKTIMGYGNHIKIMTNHPENYFYLDDRFYWMQVIHEHNLMNGIRGKRGKIFLRNLDSVKSII